METKICKKCGEEKILSDYYLKDKKMNRYDTTCKKCSYEKNKEYREKNKEQINQKSKEYNEKNKEIIKTKCKIYRENNKDKIKVGKKKYYENNKDKIKEYEYKNKETKSIYNKEYRDKNKDKMKKYNKDKYNKYKEEGKHYEYYFKNKEKILKNQKDNRRYNKEKVKEKDSLYRQKTKHIIIWRSVLRNTITRLGTSKEGHTVDILGYSAIELKNYIESLFSPYMSWENYGEWHIDHIKPVSSFGIDTPINIVSSLSNLQPMWATTREINGIIYEGNLNKGKKYE